MKGTCTRCGKTVNSLDDIHTCTPPRALVLADELEMWTLGEPAAEELRRLHAENVSVRSALRNSLENDEALLRQILDDACAVKLCEFNSMSSRHERLRLLDKMIAALRERLGEKA